jgi:hypothetical protein
VTFTAGLWNIGIEGQITLGAIFTTGLLRLLQDTGLPPAIILILAMLAGMLGGALWASLAGALKTFGGVNEIFGGLGLNFVATALTLWLIFGPWKRPGIGSMSGTEPFPTNLWLPMIEGTRLSLWAVIIGLIALTIIYIILRGSYFGLRLKAVGKNPRSSDGCLPSPDPIDLEWLWLPWVASRHADQLPGALGSPCFHLLCCSQHWQHPAADCTEAGLDLIWRAARRPGVVCPDDGRCPPESDAQGGEVIL